MSILSTLYVEGSVSPLFQIQPIPTEASLQQKLQDKTNWEAFKTMTVTKFILYKKDLHDYAALYL